MDAQERDDVEAATAVANTAREWNRRLRGDLDRPVTMLELRQLLDMVDTLASVAVRSIERGR